MERLQREYESLLASQHFDASELDYAVLDRHIARLTLLAQVANSGISVYDMFRRRHVFASYNFSELFHYDMEGIAAEDTDYFNRHIHPDDLWTLHRNGIACMRHMLEHKELASDMKLINEYRVEACGRYVRVIEQFQVLEFDRRGNVWLSLSMLDVSPNQGALDGVRSQLLNFRTGAVVAFPFSEESGREQLLSGREREILRMIGQGKLSKEIADELAISVHTVNTHRQRILEKLRAGNSLEAVRYARDRGLLG